MADESGTAAEMLERLAFTQFCEEVEDLRSECAGQPEGTRRLLARIETEARARRPILRLLAELSGENAAISRSLGARFPGIGGGHADEEQFACPDGACDKLLRTEPAGRIPRCPLFGTPMKRR